MWQADGSHVLQTICLLATISNFIGNTTEIIQQKSPEIQGIFAVSGIFEEMLDSTLGFVYNSRTYEVFSPKPIVNGSMPNTFGMPPQGGFLVEIFH